jgi:hypothetical protein
MIRSQLVSSSSGPIVLTGLAVILLGIAGLPFTDSSVLTWLDGYVMGIGAGLLVARWFFGA